MVNTLQTVFLTSTFTLLAVSLSMSEKQKLIDSRTTYLECELPILRESKMTTNEINH